MIPNGRIFACQALKLPDLRYLRALRGALPLRYARGQSTDGRITLLFVGITPSIGSRRKMMRAGGLQRAKFYVTIRRQIGRMCFAGPSPCRTCERRRRSFFDFFSSKKRPRLAALVDILGISDKKTLRGSRKKISPTPYLTVQTTKSVVWTHFNDNCDFFAAFLTSIIFYGRP